MDAIVYVCTGSCKAEISEKEYNAGLIRCGAKDCTLFGHPFERRLKCHICGSTYRQEEKHSHT